jgi:rhodanese-related sulfurtransferase
MTVEMNKRESFSVVLFLIGLIMAFLPLTGNRSFNEKPKVLLSEVLDEKTFISVDQVARHVVAEDSTVQIIDLRTPGEFLAFNIPGSINIPYNEFLNNDPGAVFSSEKTKKILYSNGDFNSNFALVLAMGIKYENIYVMKGGLNEWFKTVMESRFTGERITARENALFEIRSKARNLFTELNSLPDSLKLKYMENKRITAKKLDGGCE